MGRGRTWIALRLMAFAAVAGSGAALALGYLGWLHPAFDSFSHLRLHLAALLLLAAPLLLILRFRIEALFAVVLGVASVAQTVEWQAAPDNASAGQEAAAGAGSGPVYRLMHLNLRYDNPTPEAVLSLIGRVRPDIMTLTEVSPPWVGKLALLEAAYPYRLICRPPTFIGAAAILSRRPFAAGTEPACADRGAFAHARIDLGGREIEVAAVHMGWPWPFEQPWQLPRLEPLLAAVGGMAIVAGDLNAAPWSQSARRLAIAADARILRGVGPTWLDRRLPERLLPWIGLPIDNLMVKGEIVPATPRTLEHVGSDHLPVLMEFTLPPREKPAEKQVVSSE